MVEQVQIEVSRASEHVVDAKLSDTAKDIRSKRNLPGLHSRWSDSVRLQGYTAFRYRHDFEGGFENVIRQQDI